MSDLRRYPHADAPRQAEISSQALAAEDQVEAALRQARRGRSCRGDSFSHVTCLPASLPLASGDGGAAFRSMLVLSHLAARQNLLQIPLRHELVDQALQLPLGRVPE